MLQQKHQFAQTTIRHFFCHWIAKQIKYSSAFRPKMALTATENIVQYLQSRLWKLNIEHIIRNWILNLYEW